MKTNCLSCVRKIIVTVFFFSPVIYSSFAQCTSSKVKYVSTVSNSGKDVQKIAVCNTQYIKWGIDFKNSLDSPRCALSFRGNENGKAEVRMINVTGQIVVSKQAIISSGYNNVQVLDLGGLPKGMYVAQLLVNGVVVDKEKVVKT